LDVNYQELPAGTDFTPLLKGLNNDSCHCPYYGYIFDGKFKIIYDDGTEEILESGDIIKTNFQRLPASWYPHIVERQ
jgi:hypothetical protein